MNLNSSFKDPLVQLFVLLDIQIDSTPLALKEPRERQESWID